ncbi:PadR family transcriptional regulator [Paenibacillus cisolokensis]|uniref:PadR family transcriptional regulator n=1 Tax=Paenibacillus cisolokensis TaxID=1658519 RepID=UPI003D2DE4F8
MTKEWKQEERLFLHLGNARDTGGSGRRYFSRGGVKYALLELLSHENMHGYQMMKALEEQSGGTYKPSAGSIYPTLQMLRDQGLVEPYKQDGKRIFQITEEGRAYLQEEMERPEPFNAAEQGGEPAELGYDGHRGYRGHEDERDADLDPPMPRRNRRLTPKGKELIHLLKAAERAAIADPAKAEQLRAVLADLRQTLQHIAGMPVPGSESDAAYPAAPAEPGGSAGTPAPEGREGSPDAPGPADRSDHPAAGSSGMPEGPFGQSGSSGSQPQRNEEE